MTADLEGNHGVGSEPLDGVEPQISAEVPGIETRKREPVAVTRLEKLTTVIAWICSNLE